ncbi:TPA: host cell division inhibitor Icd-like protein [Proteus mirabilis]
MIDIAKFNSAIGWVKNYTKIFRGYLVKLRVTNRYAQKKKDSVQAVLIQLHSVEQATNYPNYIGLVKYFQSSIGGWDLMCVRLTYGVQHNNLVNNIHSVDCLALRFSDLSFFSQASITHDEKLDFSRSTLELISSSNSSGKRIPLYCDLLFLCPVAISKFQSKCFNTRKNIIKIFSKEVFKQKYLDVFKQFDVTYLNTLIIYIKKKQNPIGAENTYRASNHNVNRGNTMAMYKSTQTHPKFKWRFFSCQQSKYFSVEASNEKEARSMLPDSPCLFSARIRKEVAHG